jgi:hypothetical protein
MKTMTFSKRLLAAGMVAAGLLASQAASAIGCPNPTPDTTFTITTTVGSASCLASGTGNISGNNDAINQLGYVTLDKSDDAGTGALPGSLTFTPPTSGTSGSYSIFAPGFINLVLGIKSGEGQNTPSWAAFLLTASPTESGLWTITGTPPTNGLSHANLYGQAVPIPAALWMVGAALFGVASIGRKKVSQSDSMISA